MAYKYGFFDNQTIGVDDLNGITARFVTDGIAIDPETVGDFSGFNSKLATGGVAPETVTSLKVYLTDGVLYISPGTAFFGNGTFIEITEAEMVEYKENAENYIFLRSDVNSCSAYPVCSEKKNEEGDVLLAILNADGTVTDKRQYATGKSPCYYSSANTSLELDAVFKLGSEKYEFDIGVNNFTKMVLVYRGDPYNPLSHNHYTLSFVEFNDDGSTKDSLSFLMGTERLTSGQRILQSIDDVVYVCHRASSDYRSENRIDTTVRIEGTKLIFTPVNSNHQYSDVNVKIYLM